jgi:hypothetical protein
MGRIVEYMHRNNRDQLHKNKRVERLKAFPKVVFSHDLIYSTLCIVQFYTGVLLKTNN